MVDTFAAAMSVQSKRNTTVVFAVIADLAQRYGNVKISRRELLRANRRRFDGSTNLFPETC